MNRARCCCCCCCRRKIGTPRERRGKVKNNLAIPFFSASLVILVLELEGNSQLVPWQNSWSMAFSLPSNFYFINKLTGKNLPPLLIWLQIQLVLFLWRAAEYKAQSTRLRKRGEIINLDGHTVTVLYPCASWIFKKRKETGSSPKLRNSLKYLL